jgi:hypothetical protein
MLAAIFLCLIVAVFPILARRASTGDTPDAISVDRALHHGAFIARQPHVMGAPEIERVSEYLLASLTESGLEPETLTVEAPDAHRARARGGHLLQLRISLAPISVLQVLTLTPAE